jgi:hypothetical protein
MSNEVENAYDEKVQTRLLDVTGVSKTQGRRAVKWLRDHRSILSVYDEKTKTLRAFETKFGADSTYAQMHQALRN